MPADGPKDRDELLRRAQRARERLQADREDDAPANPNTFQRTAQRFQYWRTFADRAMQTGETIWHTYLRPLSWLLTPLFRLLWRGYVALFNKLSFDKRGKFRRHRAAAAVVSMAAATLFFGYHLVWNGIPIAARIAYDAVAINLFSYEDTLVFSKPDWVAGEHGILSVFACRRYPCEGQTDSIEFRMRDSLYLDLTRTVTKMEPHDPGELAGAFLSEENACNFEAYGIRVKYLGFYPYLFRATCRPINGANAAEVLAEMKAMRTGASAK